MTHDENSIMHKTLERRTFLKGSAAAALSAGLASSLVGSNFAMADEQQLSTPQETITPGVCRGGCGGGCQMNVHIRDGKIVKTSRIKQTNSDTSRLCNKGLTHALRVYAEDRIKHPMKRIGERGENKWEQMSWDEALDTITDKWKEVAKQYGPAANAFLKGSGNISPDAHYGLLLRSVMGATLLDAAQDRALYVAGPASLGFSQRFCGSGLEDVFNTKNLIVWGWNPTESNTTICHYNLRAKAEHGTRLIVIDPSYTITAEKADMFVPIHPGTDGVLALGMTNVMVNEGLVDEAFLTKDTVAPFLVKEDGTYLRLSDLGKATAGTLEDYPVARGADGSVGVPAAMSNVLIKGTFTINGISVTTAYDLLLERVAKWTPEKASEVCKVPVETIKELAHIMVDGPSAVAPGLGIDHYTNGVATYASIFAMTMVAGQFGKPGTGIKGSFAAESANGWMPYGLNDAPDAPPSSTFYSPALLNCMDSGKYGEDDINIKTLYIWNHNLFGTQVGGVKWRKFLDDVELLVVCDVVMTSTARYADIVLPACHYFECESASGEQTNYVFYSAKAAEPLYEAKSDFDIFQSLFEKMGLQEKGWKNRDELFEAVLTNPMAKAVNLTWDRVKKEHAVLTRPLDENYVYGADGMYMTPTGRLQFYQEKIPLDTDYGQKLDFMKERLPYWEEPIEGWDKNPLASKYPLVFTSERSKFKIHTQYTKIPWFYELEDEPYVAVNPADCQARGIVDGDYIRLFNDRGSCTLRARFNDGTRPGMVVIDHGWDQDQFVDGFYCDLIGYNVTPVVANSYYYDALIQIEKAHL